LAPLPGIALNCVFKVFPFILSYFVSASLKKKKKKKKVSVLICFAKVFAEFSTEAAVHRRI
jgi:hypothetical protein